MHGQSVIHIVAYWRLEGHVCCVAYRLIGFQLTGCEPEGNGGEYEQD